MYARQLAESLNKFMLTFESIRRIQYDAGHYQIHRPHRTPCYALHFIVGGKGDYIVNDVSLEAKLGRLFAFVPGTQFEGYSDPDDPLAQHKRLPS
jgi:hypothetical protein